jgi:hypothetical protein
MSDSNEFIRTIRGYIDEFSLVVSLARKFQLITEMNTYLTQNVEILNTDRFLNLTNVILLKMDEIIDYINSQHLEDRQAIEGSLCLQSCIRVRTLVSEILEVSLMNASNISEGGFWRLVSEFDTLFWNISWE